MNCAGASALEGWRPAVNVAMIPLLALAGSALIWLVLRPQNRLITGACGNNPPRGLPLSVRTLETLCFSEFAFKLTGKWA